MSLFIPEIPLSDFDAQAAVRARLESQFEEGSVGILAPLALRLAAITGRTTLTFPRKTVVLTAADHGHPAANADHTNAEIIRIARGHAPVNALARQAGAPVVVADVGLKQSIPEAGIVQVSAGPGTQNMLEKPVLSLPQVNDALLVGMNLASIEISKGLDILVVTAVASGARLPALAVLRLLTERPEIELTNEKKERDWIAAALVLHQPDRLDPLDILRTVGGLDLAALAGLILTGAAARIPVVLDGLGAAAAALLASYLSPAVRAYWLAAHRTGDPALDVALRALGARPLLDLGIKAAPGCGGVLALHLVEAAARLVNESR